MRPPQILGVRRLAPLHGFPWDRAGAILTERRGSRLPPMRHRGGYVLTDRLL